MNQNGEEYGLRWKLFYKVRAAAIVAKLLAIGNHAILGIIALANALRYALVQLPSLFARAITLNYLYKFQTF